MAGAQRENAHEKNSETTATSSHRDVPTTQYDQAVRAIRTAGCVFIYSQRTFLVLCRRRKWANSFLEVHNTKLILVGHLPS